MTDDQLTALIAHVDVWGQLLLYAAEVALFMVCLLVGFILGDR